MRLLSGIVARTASLGAATVLVGCATNASPNARAANTVAQASVIVGVPLAIAVGVSRTHDATLRDEDGRLVPVRDQEGQPHVVEGLVIGGVTAAVAAVCWGYMVYADATEAPASSSSSPEQAGDTPFIGDAPPAPASPP
jgi:hypothetical protein